MSTRSKLIIAALGFAVSAGAIDQASATTIGRIVKTHVAVTKSTKVVAPKLHRLHFATHKVGKRSVAHVRLVHRAPPVGFRKIVRVNKQPILQKQVLAHSLIVKKTVIR